MDQRSDEWFAARLGRVTASRVADVVAKTKTGYSASRTNYRAQLVCERLTGQRADEYVSAAMLNGIEKEPEARAAYEWETDATVTEIGFVDHPRIAMSGASPDGLVGDDGLVEIKCPTTATHIATLLGGKVIPSKYEAQVQWQMACTGRQWCDFVSYDPRLPDEMRLFVVREKRNDALIAELEEEVSRFLAEVDETVSKLRERYMQEAA